MKSCEVHRGAVILIVSSRRFCSVGVKIRIVYSRVLQLLAVVAKRSKIVDGDTVVKMCL